MTNKIGESKAPKSKSAPTAQSNVLKIVEIEKAQKNERTFGEKISELIAEFCGSMLFVYVHIVAFVVWIILNTVVPRFQFDPYPFTFLTLVVSLEAIFLSTFILISQNQETRQTERRNNLDLQINMFTEQKDTKILELVRAIAIKVGVDCADDDLASLLEPLDHEKLVKDIFEATAKHRKLKI